LRELGEVGHRAGGRHRPPPEGAEFAGRDWVTLTTGVRGGDLFAALVERDARR
jgi:hypothetical protein